MKNYDKFIGLIAAAGLGQRLGADKPKQFLPLAGRPLLAWSAEAMEKTEEIAEIIVICPAGREEEARSCLKRASKPCHIIRGGPSRQESVALGLDLAQELGYGWVVIHDAARPFARPELFRRVMAQARRHGAALAAWPCSDTVKTADQEANVKSTLPREQIWLAQTPQAFALPLLKAAAELSEGLVCSDEAALLELNRQKVKLVAAPRANFKITAPEDWISAQQLLCRPRIGFGFDAHRLIPDRRLILGGVAVDYHLGLQGHSDADVLTHALMDALLAAAGLGDIGLHFPDHDPAYAGISSLKLLAAVKLKLAGYEIQQINALIMAQAPKMAPHIPAMRANWALTLATGEERINIAATTTEGMGYIGKGEGMAAQAQVMLMENSIF
ncbi:MAG: 2-C-methyl-D-erythritol 4-phosphate cytidylyltransferase [Desulfarculales bacterium]|jgi:2-C-methyl-D-erythritol 4-phosphate cytidylyltransferase/2-C-methyl-D-erythritol 2,4-cyclodiphosphate synthase|nr:2-C-methyl-D-erythritol 4-phosphate cytidylyltransferase [Desulfarculales bacterium]